MIITEEKKNKYITMLYNLIVNDEKLNEVWTSDRMVWEKVSPIITNCNEEIHCGASRMVFNFDDNYVLKVDLDEAEGSWDENGDFCEIELNNWNAVKGRNIAKAFCSMEFLGTILNRKVYIMPAVLADAFEVEDRTINSYYKIHPETESIDFDDIEWDYEFLEILFEDWYGETFTEELVMFLKEYGINDIHTGNVGFVYGSGAPVIFDYAGF